MLGKEVRRTMLGDEMEGLLFWNWIQGAGPFEQPTCGADTGLDEFGAPKRVALAGSNFQESYRTEIFPGCRVFRQEDWKRHIFGRWEVWNKVCEISCREDVQVDGKNLSKALCQCHSFLFTFRRPTFLH